MRVNNRLRENYDDYELACMQAQSVVRSMRKKFDLETIKMAFKDTLAESKKVNRRSLREGRFNVPRFVRLNDYETFAEVCPEIELNYDFVSFKGAWAMIPEDSRMSGLTASEILEVDPYPQFVYGWGEMADVMPLAAYVTELNYGWDYLGLEKPEDEEAYW